MRRALPGVLTAIASLVLVVWLYLGNIVFKNYDELGKTPTPQIGTVTNIVRTFARACFEPIYSCCFMAITRRNQCKVKREAKVLIVVRSVSRGNPNPANLVTVRVGSRQGLVNTHLPIHVDEKLSVECRIGRSGTFYIDYFSPVIVTQ